MGPRRDRRDYCYAESKPCIDWVQRYLKNCLCNLRDYVSFRFGLLSVSLWAVAEIPQIITNFKAKSSQGVSILLLMTWILGSVGFWCFFFLIFGAFGFEKNWIFFDGLVFSDVFNLADCVLEPSTVSWFSLTFTFSILNFFLIFRTLIWFF